MKHKLWAKTSPTLGNPDLVVARVRSGVLEVVVLVGISGLDDINLISYFNLPI